MKEETKEPATAVDPVRHPFERTHVRLRALAQWSIGNNGMQ